MSIVISECGSSRFKRKKDMIENCMAAQAKDLHDMNADVVKEDTFIMKTVREITRVGNVIQTKDTVPSSRLPGAGGTRPALL